MRPIFDVDPASRNIADDRSATMDFHAIADDEISPQRSPHNDFLRDDVRGDCRISADADVVARKRY